MGKELEYYSNTIKYFLLAIKQFSPLLQKLKQKTNDESVKEKIDNILDFYHDFENKTAEYSLNLEDPNKIYDGEKITVRLTLGEAEIKHLVQIVVRMLKEWNADNQRIRKNTFKTQKNIEDLECLWELIWPLEACFKNESSILYKYKDLPRLVFPGEKTSKIGPSVDTVDTALEKIGPHLSEMRRGMWAALKNNHPDSGRQAVASARELFDQVLKESVSEELRNKTRKERIGIILRMHRKEPYFGAAETIEGICASILDEHDKRQSLLHGRATVPLFFARWCVERVESALKLFFGDQT